MISLLLLALAAPSDAVAGGPAPYVITHPDWKTRPQQGDVQGAYPQEALERGFDGEVDVSCRVRASGTLSDCTAEGEGPYATQFQDAAVYLSRFYRLASLPAAQASAPLPMVRYRFAFHIAANTLPAIRAVQPGAREGHVSVSCRVSPRRDLENCHVASVDAGRADLYDAAMKVAARIALADTMPVGVRVILPVHVAPPQP